MAILIDTCYKALIFKIALMTPWYACTEGIQFWYVHLCVYVCNSFVIHDSWQLLYELYAYMLSVLIQVLFWNSHEAPAYTY